MPTPWPTRLLPGSTSQHTTESTGRSPPKQTSNAGSSAKQSQTSTSNRTHSHSRSSSQPLARIMPNRAPSFSWTRRPDLDDELDDASAKVLDGLVGQSPVKKSSAQASDAESGSMAPCMCCGQKSKFPKGTTTFRCTQCLTVNDLRPYRPRQQAPKDAAARDGERSTSSARDTFSTQPDPVLSIERTRAIIDSCLTAYLKSRLSTEARKIPIQLPQTLALRPQKSFSRPGAYRTASSEDDRPKGQAPLANAPSFSLASREPLSASIKSPADLEWTDYAGSSGIPVPLTDQRDKGGAQDTPAISRKPLPGRTGPSSSATVRRPPPPTQTSSAPAIVGSLAPPRDFPARGASIREDRAQVTAPQPPSVSRERYEKAKRIFRPLEDYMLQSYGSFECLNASFSTVRPQKKARTLSESSLKSPPPELASGLAMDEQNLYPQLDPKMLLLGDIAENGDWWTGRLARKISERTDRRRDQDRDDQRGVTSRTPNIDWTSLERWYDLARSADRSWSLVLTRLQSQGEDVPELNRLDPSLKAEIELDLSIAREHAERTLFKVMEQLLRRPGRQLNDPEHLRFLILILSHPLLYPSHVQQRRVMGLRGAVSRQGSTTRRPSNTNRRNGDLQHAGILKRTLGLLAGSSDACHRHLIAWFSRMPENRYLDLMDLLSSFVSYRLSRRKVAPKSGDAIDDGGLIPTLTGSAQQTSAQLQSAAGLSGGTKHNNDKDEAGNVDYTEDWQLRAAAKVMALMFAANNSWSTDRSQDALDISQEVDRRPRSTLQGQLLPVSDFYNSMLDYQDVIADFKTWEAKKGKFAFCQYPFFLSMGAKMRILEYDARRQMESKARETYFNNVISGRAQDINFHLHVRRECVVEDSLQRIGEAVGQLQGDLKKSLKVHFAGEEGVDAGGLRKEWFMLVVRDIFDANHGMFLYDDESHLCYFNPHSFETSDQYYMVGVLFGLAIYNSIILDVAFPSFAFRKLIASAPATGQHKHAMTYTLDDLAELHPSLAAGLRTLLAFDGDVESTYCWTFSVPLTRYGVTTQHPLLPSGENKPVTNANRAQFVSLYVRYLLDTAVARQFEPFKRGFFTVCAGNALSLFRPEEIDLLIRGDPSAGPIDVDALRAVAEYDNFRDSRGKPVPHPERLERVRWFWAYFASAPPKDQRRLLQFVTGSDRIPAAGAAGLVLRIVAGGDGTGTAQGENDRFPVARTCFNTLTLWGWRSRERLVERIRGAVEGSEGFGLK